MGEKARRVTQLAREASGEAGFAAGLRALPPLREELERLERRHVREALEAGWSWRAIAEALGVAKQTAHRKHGRAAPVRRSGHRSGGSPRRILITADARRAMNLAGTEARVLGHRCVRPEHVLLGLLRLPSGSAPDALRAGGVSLESVRAATAATADADSPTRAGLTAEARRVIERALDHVTARRDGWLGEEHLLLALLEDAAAAAALASAGGDGAEVRRALDGGGEAPRKA